MTRVGLYEMGAVVSADTQPRPERRAVPVGRADAMTGRWAHTCAWNGHELLEMAYVQVSAHERVCWFHHPMFRTWVEEVSKRRAAHEERAAA